MIMAYLFLLMLYLGAYIVFTVISGFMYQLKIQRILEGIKSKNDLLYLKMKDFIYVVAEVLRRHGHSVEITDRFGEGCEGIILDKIYYVQVSKCRFSNKINIELARKLKKSMQLNSIHKGMYITLGGFNENTRRYCHANVITCIDGDTLFNMCRKVQGLQAAGSNLPGRFKI